MTVVATSVYSGYPASNLIDFDNSTSWYVDSLCSMQTMDFCCISQNVQLTLSNPRTISAVVIRGNRDFSSGFDVLTGTLELIGANGGVLATRAVVTSRPAGDWAIAFSPAVANVRTVRFTPGWSDSSASGFAELQLYGP